MRISPHTVPAQSMFWAGVAAGWSHLLNATGIWRVWSICAADFTAWSRWLIYECTGGAGPAWLKREIWKSNCSLCIIQIFALVMYMKLENWSTSIRGYKSIQIYLIMLCFLLNHFRLWSLTLKGFISRLICPCYNGTVCGNLRVFVVYDYVATGHLFTIQLYLLVSRNGKCECM